jgi:hypothetical protein
MSTLLEQASLVMIPSGYKEDVVYSQIPTSGAGDLSFTRASNGTRINSAGLVEVCPWNLCTNSEDQTQWTSQNETTVTANSTTAPNGTLTADTVTPTAVNDDHYRGIGLSSQVGELTAFIYVKPNGYNFFDWGIWNGSSYLVRATFDLVNLTYTFTNAGTATIESVGNGWLKCGISGSNASLSTIDLYYRVRPTGGTGFFTGNGTSGAFIWGAQLNIGSTAKPYFPTTDRLNVPRLTYQNGGGGCPSLLLEKQSTNVFVESENLFTTHLVQNITTSGYSNIATSPDGTQNAEKFVPNSTSGVHGIANSSSLSITSGQAYSFSAFVKSDGGPYNLISLTFDGSLAWGGTKDCIFNASTGASYSVPTGATMSSQDMGNGWYRITATLTAMASISSLQYLYRIYIADANGNLSWAASSGNTNGIFVWGAQLEASSYPTSYIPTTSSSATRVGDACYKTGISSLIGQTSGTLFADFKVDNANPGARIISVSDGTFANRIVLLQDGSAIRVFVATASVGQVDNSFGTWIGRHKIAVAYANNDLVVFLDGVLVATDTSISVPACSAAQVGTREDNTDATPLQGTINQAILFPTRLTNAELASLTTL